MPADISDIFEKMTHRKHRGYEIVLFILSITLLLSTGMAYAGIVPPPEPVINSQICVYQRNVTITPDELDADAPTINVLNLRAGSYAWNGEQMGWLVIIRDPDGAIDIGQAYINVDSSTEVVCNPVPLPEDDPATEMNESSCDGLRPTGNSGLGNGLLDPATDKAFHCLYTVEPTDPDKDVTIAIGLRDARNQISESLYAERWRLNPSVGLNVVTSDGMPVTFEAAKPGEFAHSMNRVFIENTGQRVALWVFIAMTDLFDMDGAAKCPETNKIDAEGNSMNEEDGVYYRARSGTLITNLIGFAGDNPAEGWAHITNPNQNFGCDFFTIIADGMCSGARPLFDDTFLLPPIPFPVTGWPNNVLLPTGQAEVEFKIRYPEPCVGTFSSGQIFVYGKPV